MCQFYQSYKTYQNQQNTAFYDFNMFVFDLCLWIYFEILFTWLDYVSIKLDQVVRRMISYLSIQNGCIQNWCSWKQKCPTKLAFIQKGFKIIWAIKKDAYKIGALEKKDVYKISVLKNFGKPIRNDLSWSFFFQ